MGQLGTLGRRLLINFVGISSDLQVYVLVNKDDELSDTRSLAPVMMEGWKLKVRKESYRTLHGDRASQPPREGLENFAESGTWDRGGTTKLSSWFWNIGPALSFSFHGSDPESSQKSWWKRERSLCLDCFLHDQAPGLIIVI